MEMKSDPEADNYLYYDPKVQKKMHLANMPRRTTPFREAMVFVIGGGDYVKCTTFRSMPRSNQGRR